MGRGGYKVGIDSNERYHVAETVCACAVECLFHLVNHIIAWGFINILNREREITKEKKKR